MVRYKWQPWLPFFLFPSACGVWGGYQAYAAFERLMMNLEAHSHGNILARQDLPLDITGGIILGVLAGIGVPCVVIALAKRRH